MNIVSPELRKTLKRLFEVIAVVVCVVGEPTLSLATSVTEPDKGLSGVKKVFVDTAVFGDKKECGIYSQNGMALDDNENKTYEAKFVKKIIVNDVVKFGFDNVDQVPDREKEDFVYLYIKLRYFNLNKQSKCILAGSFSYYREKSVFNYKGGEGSISPFVYNKSDNMVSIQKMIYEEFLCHVTLPLVRNNWDWVRLTFTGEVCKWN